MADKPQSPFTGLDRALLRATKTQQTSPIQEEPKPESKPIEQQEPRKHVTQQASEMASGHARMLAPDAQVIEGIRKTVKVTGKEVSFIRLTPDEKQELADIVYTYRRQGKKTTENEIARIALNYLLADYHASGELSVLARVIEALLA